MVVVDNQCFSKILKQLVQISENARTNRAKLNSISFDIWLNVNILKGQYLLYSNDIVMYSNVMYSNKIIMMLKLYKWHIINLISYMYNGRCMYSIQILNKIMIKGKSLTKRKLAISKGHNSVLMRLNYCI